MSLRLPPSVAFTFLASCLFAACGGESSPAANADPTDAGGPNATADASPSGDASPSPGDAAVPGDTTPTPSSGCLAASDAFPIGTTEGSVMSSGTERTFRIHVPPSFKAGTPTPVVLMLHGGGGSADQFENDSSVMDPIADRDGFITVYPDGTGTIKTWNAGSCCGKAKTDGIDDVAFMNALLDRIEAKTCVDKQRIFATGMSNGGLMSHRLACELSTRIAALAPVAGTIGVATCTPPRPVPIMHIHGTLDGHVPWNGGVGCGPSTEPFTSVPATIDGWRARNGCGTTTSTYFEQGDGKCTLYADCKAPVILCAIEGGGHSWPGGKPKTPVSDCVDGAQSTTFLADEAAWQFFKKNPMPK